MEYSAKSMTKKIVLDCEKLSRIAEGLRDAGFSIVATIGSWDLLHIGHLRYLMKAKTYGDILIVGTDSDRAIKLYKNPLRPIVPEDERMEMLSYQSCVDFITLVDDVDDKGKWQYGLLEHIKPDVFIAVENSYPEEQKQDIEKLCGKLVVLPRQAEKTSTSGLVQETIKKHLLEMLSSLERR